jgi:transcriptional regulator with XRE-family HTH domain
MKSASLLTIPIRADRALKKLGQDLKDARLRRRIPLDILAKRSMISRGTLYRIEKGAPEVSMGIYATVLFMLGLESRLADLADVTKDLVGLDLQEENLPKRIRLPKPKVKKENSDD